MSLVEQYNEFYENFRKIIIEREDRTGRLHWKDNCQKSLKKMIIVAKINENTKLFREIKQKTKMLFCKYPELQRSRFYDKINMQSENQTKISENFR